MFSIIECQFGSYTVPHKADVTIGRSIDSTIRFFDDVAVSRHHCVIGYRSGVLTIVDLESLNGTYINEHPVSSSMPLHHGDIIRVGASEMKVAIQKDEMNYHPECSNCGGDLARLRKFVFGNRGSSL